MMAGIFSKPKIPQQKRDPNQEKLVTAQREQIAGQDAEIAERKAARRKFNTGRASLLSGAETGVPARTSLG